MKKRIPTFLAGMVTMVILLSLVVGVFAASGMTITVNPINVQVNGATFQPKDAQGNSVPVFTYNGTTYAPLRALAEAYGLKVGYDAEKNMATVGEAAPAKTPANKPAADYSTWTAEEEKAYQEFSVIGWKANLDELDKNGIVMMYYIENDPDKATEIINYLKKYNDATTQKASARFSNDIYEKYHVPVFGDKDGSYMVSYNVILNGKWKNIWNDDVYTYGDGKTTSSCESSRVLRSLRDNF